MTDATFSKRIISLAGDYWDDYQWMNRQHILSRLANRGWRVVYSNGTLSLQLRHSKRWKESSLRDKVESRGNIHLYQSGQLNISLGWSRTWDRIVVKRHVNRLVQAAGGNPDWLIVFSPRYAPYVRPLNTRVAYHVYDHFPGFPNWNAQLADWHAELVERADLLSVASAAAGAELPGDGPQRVRLLPNGVDIHAFEAAAKDPCPQDFLKIPSPRIIYAGNLNAKVDFGVVLHCARNRPSHNWIFIGSTGFNLDSLSEKRLNEYQHITRMPNVIFLGVKDRSKIPAYIYHSDAIAIPYQLSGGWAIHGCPLKLFEGLATGRPVVCSPLPAVLQYESVVALPLTPDQWLESIEHALQGGVGTPEARRAAARESSWEDRVDLYERWLLDP